MKTFLPFIFFFLPLLSLFLLFLPFSLSLCPPFGLAVPVFLVLIGIQRARICCRVCFIPYLTQYDIHLCFLVWQWCHHKIIFFPQMTYSTFQLQIIHARSLAGTSHIILHYFWWYLFKYRCRKAKEINWEPQGI